MVGLRLSSFGLQKHHPIKLDEGKGWDLTPSVQFGRSW